MSKERVLVWQCPWGCASSPRLGRLLQLVAPAQPPGQDQCPSSPAALFSLWGLWPLSGCFQVTVPFPLPLVQRSAFPQPASAWPPSLQHPDLELWSLTPSLCLGGFELGSGPGAGGWVSGNWGTGSQQDGDVLCLGCTGGFRELGLSPRSLGEWAWEGKSPVTPN